MMLCVNRSLKVCCALLARLKLPGMFTPQDLPGPKRKLCPSVLLTPDPDDLLSRIWRLDAGRETGNRIAVESKKC
ncbi:hypothetical protein FMA36_17895 (plasmid) [Komagataeibacter xylinus]|uniref:Uncharacterized protein n=1 Tax=Komagataeibacter xylinus TaxID=28448 RepID=A0A857FUS3_KOMXY|nr:hypothetical protein FMA36_17895 [Komagataeibacter xylinus]